ncbi:RNA polymerase sigma factor [Silvibacterium acidisoli]|uniref:RNA polymerase sigma factor n=1 Tax=Acidobacteriaceae bacterium ZG23-2 TaxID=2883246 RepID=UPI00406CA2E9
MSLLNTHNLPQIPRALLDDPADVLIDDGAVLMDGMAGAMWLRAGEEEVALVTGVESFAQRLDEKHGGDGASRKSSSKPATSREVVGDWRQQTLTLYDAIKPKLTQFLRRLGLDKDEMDDVIQETFLRVAAYLREGDVEENLDSWVYRVARNLAMDVHRVNRRQREVGDLEFEPGEEPLDPDGSPEWTYLQNERFKRVTSRLSQLTPQQYNSILLRGQGLRYREIGRLLGISEQRAVHLVKRGLQRLMGGL